MTSPDLSLTVAFFDSLSSLISFLLSSSSDLCASKLLSKGLNFDCLSFGLSGFLSKDLSFQDRFHSEQFE